MQLQSQDFVTLTSVPTPDPFHPVGDMGAENMK